ncbi:MAG: tetratricopeptide repeat protein [Planctomycetota bacterium]
MSRTDIDSETALSKAIAFFERAAEVAVTDNFDYAIEMYLEGLRLSPDALVEGHGPLRHMALIRHGKGGKKPSMVEKVKFSRSKTPLEQMLNAEYLLAKDPDNLAYAEAMLKAAVAGGYKRTAEWIADLIFEANRTSDKPSLPAFLLLRDSYAALELFSKAIAACRWAVKLKPDDGSLADDVRDLSAQLAVQKGKYAQKGKYGDFRDSLKNQEQQRKLHDQQRIVKTEQFRTDAVEQARQKLAEDPSNTTKILNLASALSDMETDPAAGEALDLLEKSYLKNHDFTFKRHQGQIQLKQVRRKIRQAREAVESEPGNMEAKQRVADLVTQLHKAELEHYRLCVEHYPTDARLKYELGLCYMRNKLFDEAIPLLQEARKDPHNRFLAMEKIGICFIMKAWLNDAIDVFTQAVDQYEIKDDDLAKELRYNLARCYEQKGDMDSAIELYRRLAQIDFGFKDVSRRIERLRNNGRQNAES